MILGALLALFVLPASAQGQEDKSVALKGKVKGGSALLNAVWNEAAKADNNRYTFRAPSTSVSKDARILRAYLPRELCIVALSAGPAQAAGTPIPIHVSGGRTTPTTIVIPSGQNVQFINHDPFPHKLFDVAGVKGGMGPEETAPKKPRVWRPPGPGTYEIRDKLFPSVRTWIVVEPRAAAFGTPMLTKPDEFVITGLTEGSYTLRGYFEGKPVGEELKVEVKSSSEQTVKEPLVVAAEPKKKEK